MWKAKIICVCNPPRCYERPWNAHGRWMNISKRVGSARTKVWGKENEPKPSSHHWAWVQKDKGGKMGEADAVICKNIQAWLSEIQLAEHHSCVSDQALVSGFPANGYFFFKYIYSQSKLSHALKETNPTF